MEEILQKRLNLVTSISKNKLELIKSLNKMNLLMSLVLLKVKVLPVLWRDGELDIYKKNPTEVTEKLDVLEHGIHPELLGLSPEQVNKVISIEHKSIKKSIESEKVKEGVQRIMLPPKLILLKKISLLWVVSLTMVLFVMILLSLRDAVLVLKNDSCY